MKILPLFGCSCLPAYLRPSFHSGLSALYATGPASALIAPDGPSGVGRWTGASAPAGLAASWTSSLLTAPGEIFSADPSFRPTSAHHVRPLTS